MKRFLILVLCLGIFGCSDYISTQKQEGAHETYYESGQLRGEETFKDDKRQSSILKSDAIIKNIHEDLMKIKDKYAALKEYGDDNYKRADISKKYWFPSIDYYPSRDLSDKGIRFLTISIYSYMGPYFPVFVAHSKELSLDLQVVCPGSDRILVQEIVDIVKRNSKEFAIELEYDQSLGFGISE